MKQSQIQIMTINPICHSEPQARFFASFRMTLLIPAFAGMTILLSSSFIFASSNAGTSTANFLKVGVGARGSGMGEAQSAVVEDVSSLYWNPAGLSRMRFQEVSLMHYSLVEGIRFQQLSYGVPTQKRGTFGVGVNVMDYGSISAFDTGGVPNGAVDASNLLITASWANMLHQKSKLSLGLNAKYLRSDLAGFKAAVPMADVGLLLPFETGRLRGLRLSAGLRNVGPAIKFDREASALPRQFVFGTGFTALGGNLTVALDTIKPNDNDLYVATGLEYRIFDMLQLRAGYNTLSNLVGNGLSYGIGLKFTQWNVDYAFVPFGSLGNTNRISVGVRFGRGVKMKSAEDQVEHAYRMAQRQMALGNGVEAYKTLNDILLIAPWHKPSVEFKAKIQKQFDEMSVSKNRARMDAEIADEFTRAKDAFDRDELVQARKGFEAILQLQSDHVGAKVYLERIQNRYASLANEAFKEGMAYFAAGDYQKAKTAFEKTLTIDRHHIDAKAQLDKTEEMIKDASRRSQEMAKLAGAADAYKAGLEAYQRNDLELALKKFEEVQKAAPEYEEVGRYYDLTRKSLGSMLFDQSQVHFQNGQLEEAVKKLERAIQLVPEDSRVKPALEVSSRDLATQNAQDSRKLYKDGLEAYLNGQTGKAEQLWKRALELDPSNDDALKAITKLEEQKKNANPNQEKK